MVFIKEELGKLGYFCSEFYCLKSLEDSRSSREVLIAIGWLVYTYEIINLLIENSSCPSDEEYFKDELSLKVKLNKNEIG